MPDINNPDTAKDIAQAYCTNGRKKTQALITAGYSESYARTTKGMRIYNRKPVIDAINAYQHKIDAKSAYTATKAQQELDEALEIARQQHNPNAMVSAITGKCKLYALMTERVQTEDIQKPDIKPEEQEILEELASEYKKRLSGIKIA